MNSGPYFFGLHDGHLTALADKIASRHGASHTNYTEPRGEKRGWFSAPNLGAPFDVATEQAVLDSIERAGGIDALRRKPRRSRMMDLKVV